MAAIKHEGPLYSATTERKFLALPADIECRHGDRHLRYCIKQSTLVYKDGAGGYWVQQFGSMDDATERYHQIKKEMQCYKTH